MRVMLPRGATKAFNGTKLPKTTRYKHDNRTKTGNLVRFGPRLRHRSQSKARLGVATCRHAPTCPGNVPAADTMWQGSPGERSPQAMKKRDTAAQSHRTRPNRHPTKTVLQCGTGRFGS